MIPRFDHVCSVTDVWTEHPWAAFFNSNSCSVHRHQVVTGNKGVSRQRLGALTGHRIEKRSQYAGWQFMCAKSLLSMSQLISSVSDSKEGLCTERTMSLHYHSDQCLTSRLSTHSNSARIIPDSISCNPMSKPSRMEKLLLLILT